MSRFQVPSLQDPGGPRPTASPVDTYYTPAAPPVGAPSIGTPALAQIAKALGDFDQSLNQFWFGPKRELQIRQAEVDAQSIAAHAKTMKDAGTLVKQHKLDRGDNPFLDDLVKVYVAKNASSTLSMRAAELELDRELLDTPVLERGAAFAAKYSKMEEEVLSEVGGLNDPFMAGIFRSSSAPIRDRAAANFAQAARRHSIEKAKEALEISLTSEIADNAAAMAVPGAQTDAHVQALVDSLELQTRTSDEYGLLSKAEHNEAMVRSVYGAAKLLVTQGRLEEAQALKNTILRAKSSDGFEIAKIPGMAATLDRIEDDIYTAEYRADRTREKSEVNNRRDAAKALSAVSGLLDQGLSTQDIVDALTPSLEGITDDPQIEVRQRVDAELSLRSRARQFEEQAAVDAFEPVVVDFAERIATSGSQDERDVVIQEIRDYLSASYDPETKESRVPLVTRQKLGAMAFQPTDDADRQVYDSGMRTSALSADIAVREFMGQSQDLVSGVLTYTESDKSTEARGLIYIITQARLAEQIQAGEYDDLDAAQRGLKINDTVKGVIKEVKDLLTSREEGPKEVEAKAVERRATLTEAEQRRQASMDEIRHPASSADRSLRTAKQTLESLPATTPLSERRKQEEKVEKAEARFRKERDDLELSINVGIQPPQMHKESASGQKIFGYLSPVETTHKDMVAMSLTGDSGVQFVRETARRIYQRSLENPAGMRDLSIALVSPISGVRFWTDADHYNRELAEYEKIKADPDIVTRFTGHAARYGVPDANPYNIFLLMEKMHGFDFTPNSPAERKLLKSVESLLVTPSDK